MNDDAKGKRHAANYSVNNNKTTTSRSFEWKAKFIGRTPSNHDTLDTKFFVLLKHSNNFWKSLELLLINCEIKFD